MLETLKKLIALPGVSGNEEKVREFIYNRINSYVDEIYIDALGSIISVKYGKWRASGCNNEAVPKVMLSAHMDEVGFVITAINDDGTLKFQTVGGIETGILPGKKILLGNNVPAIIGCKPIHLQEKEEFEKRIEFKNLYLDIGTTSKEESEKFAPIGTYGTFEQQFTILNGGKISGRALDDRVGCAILMTIIECGEEFWNDVYFCFTTMEEIGLRGSKTVAQNIKPDIAIVVEATTCADVPGVEEDAVCTISGNGPALTIMDRSTISDKNLNNFIIKAANSNSLKYQFKRLVAGGNDASSIQRAGEGCRVASISVPCRYIHSSQGVMDKEDMFLCKELIVCTLRSLENTGGKIC